jgi:ribonuclease HI
MFSLKFDGGSSGNPGLSGAGSVIYEDDVEIWAGAFYVGAKETNNTAEYYGVIYGLEEAIRRNIVNIAVYGDSELVIKQIKGIYQVKAKHLTPLYNMVMVLIGYFDTVTFNHIPRNQNKRADELSNIGRLLDK